MSNDTAVTKLRRRVASALGIHTIEDIVWEDVVEMEHVGTALDMPDDDDEPSFVILRERVKVLRKRFLGLGPRAHWPVHVWPSMESAYTPYVIAMTRATAKPGPRQEGQYVPGFPDPLSSSLVGGRIRVEAEAWVPAKSVTLAFRDLQTALLDEGRRFQSISAKALDRWQWIKSQREEHSHEGWRGNMDAWNRDHEMSERYDDVRNFRRDFLRTEEFVAHARHMRRTAQQWEAVTEDDFLRYERAGIVGLRIKRA